VRPVYAIERSTAGGAGGPFLPQAVSVSTALPTQSARIIFEPGAKPDWKVLDRTTLHMGRHQTFMPPSTTISTPVT
jgi:hypothetical protein